MKRKLFILIFFVLTTVAIISIYNSRPVQADTDDCESCEVTVE